jgi:hypothetical protein
MASRQCKCGPREAVANDIAAGTLFSMYGYSPRAFAATVGLDCLKVVIDSPAGFPGPYTA